MNAIAEAPAILITPPQPGALWPEQGGRYVGSYVKAGQLHHGIIADGVDTDIKASFNKLAESPTNIEINGFSDWRAPDQRELMLAFIHAPDNFMRSGWDSIYMTSTPYGSDYVWVVDFEGGDVFTCYRDSEWRVRPFRSIIA
ncbi:MAG: DUF1566 domain-containing protein [Pseudomonadales bacterium]